MALRRVSTILHAFVYSFLVVLVLPAPPGPILVASLGSTVKPLEHPPEAVNATGIAGVCVVADAVFQGKRANARPFPEVCARVGPAHSRVRGRV